MTTPEGLVKTDVKRYLHQLGFIQAGMPEEVWKKQKVVGWYYMPTQNGMGVTGIPDFVGCWHGQFFAIETKAPGHRNDVTPNQEQRIKEIRAAGGWCFIIDDVQQLQEQMYESRIA